MADVDGLLHFNFRTLKDGWILRLMTRIRSSQNEAIRERLPHWAELGLGDYAGAISTRTKLVELITKRINASLTSLGDGLDITKAELCMREGAAYRLDDSLVFGLLLDFDSFIFETRSCYEITIKFVDRFLSEVLGEQSNAAGLHERLAREIGSRGCETAWIGDLRDLRHDLIHERAGWPALQIESLAPLKGNLVLLLNNVDRLDNQQDYISMEQCQRIYRGFLSAFPAIEQWLLCEIEKLESERSS